MPRERASDYENKTRLIKDAAAELFSETGYPGTKLIDIARACNVSKSMLYHYFETKDELLYSMIDEHLEDVLSSFEKVTLKTQDAEKEFAELLSVLMQQSVTSRQRNIVAMSEAKYLPDNLYRKVQTKERAVLKVLENTLHKLNPDLAPSLLTPYALMLAGLVNWTDTWFDDKGALTRENLIDRVGHLYLNGFLGTNT
jgi:AcrR family transcriptional regulator|tara:strand:+ start:2645 stop:3238 length:594 start_codon:yes stop_codon:yes gene_type:complete